MSPWISSCSVRENIGEKRPKQHERFVEVMVIDKVGHGGQHPRPHLVERQHVAAIVGGAGERFQHAPVSQHRGRNVAFLPQQIGFAQVGRHPFQRFRIELAGVRELA